MQKFSIKLILILTGLQCIQLAGVKVYGQYEVKDKILTVGELIELIEEKSDVVFLYNDKDVDLTRIVSFIDNYPDMQELLERMFINSQNTYKMSGKQIYIVRSHNVPEKTVSLTDEKIKISGTVTDSEGPLIGVNIRIKDSGTGTATDNNGYFSMEGVDSEAILEITYIGYETLYVQAKQLTGKTIQMQQQASQVKEVVVTAQAIGQKNAIQRQINSNTIKNVISAEKLQQNPDVNVVEAIGRLPGISVNRYGGEGRSFNLRGLDQSYARVLINGESLPVGLYAISPYSLQGVEVYKTLTANQEGDAVAGSVDLTLRETPKGFHYTILAESGYNALNNDFANYNLVGQVSNRFFDDKLGFFLSLNANRLNRSTNLMNVGYNTNYTTNLNDPFYISSISFNLNKIINYIQSAVLTLDYKPSNATAMYLQSFLSANNSYQSTQAKSFSTEGGEATIPIFISIYETPSSRNYGITNNLFVKTNFSFLNSKLNYGISYTYNKSQNPGTNSWSYSSETRADGLYRDSLKVFSPARIAGEFDEILTSLTGTKLEIMSIDRSEGASWNVAPRFDYEIPFKTGNGFLHGKIQIGGKYRLSKSKSDRMVATASCGGNANFMNFIMDKFNWSSGYAELLVDSKKNNFLGGAYSFGDTYSINRNNQVLDAWLQNGKEHFLTGGAFPEAYGFIYDLYNSAMNDRNNTHQYSAAYIMPEINIGKWLMLLPGIRFENSRSDIKAYKGHETTRRFSIAEDIVSAYGLEQALAIRKDRFLLPMLHVRVRPTSWFYTHFSYTHTVRRPSDIAPYEYYNAQDPSRYSYQAGNPDLKTELWKSYDLQFTFHSPKLGLFSVTGFNKTVQDKLWARGFTRIPGDPIPHEIFKDIDLVNMTVFENHPYDIILRGIETEWQTSFGFLPKPLSYLTLSVNYTYTHGQSPNPYTRLYKYIPEGGRYELTGRQDSVVTEPMTGMPKHMVNITLGVEIKDFKSYLSYQYTTDKIQSTHPNDLRLYIINDPYNRLDFNASYGFHLKNKSLLELLVRIANITNSEDRIRYREEKRPIRVEQYGLTASVGLRYRY